MKYFIDYMFLLIIFPIFIVLFPIIFLFILLFDSGPVIYSQKRVGLNGQEFKLHKFRTMSVSSDEKIHKDHYKDLSQNKKIEPSLTPDDPIRIENDDRIIDIHEIQYSNSEYVYDLTTENHHFGSWLKSICPLLTMPAN